MRAISSRADMSPLTSAPALNARSPAPVSTMQRHASSRSSSSQHRPRSASMARVIALRRGWLSMVMTTTWRPWRSREISISGSPSGESHPRSAPGSALADEAHDLAVGAPVGEEPDRLDAALQREAMGDARREAALAVPAHQLLGGGAQLVRRVPPEVAERRAHGRAVLDEQ